MKENGIVMVRMSARISGRVQGVGFRAFALHQARELGVAGWVKNTPNGDVRIVAEGTRSQLVEFEQSLHEGPPSAHVIEIDVVWEQASAEFDMFQIRYGGI